MNRFKSRPLLLTIIHFLLFIVAWPVETDGFCRITERNFVPRSKNNPPHQIAPRIHRNLLSLDAAAMTSSKISLESLTYNKWNLKYLYKPAAKGCEGDPPLLLIHPIGIGLSSWYWQRFMKLWNGAACYAPDLIGCGIHHESDAWQPNELGMFVPLDWVRECEALLGLMRTPSIFRGQRGCIIVTQGGLAVVGILLAARNSESVRGLVLCSPPIWKDLIEPVPDQELQKNYNFLRSPILGRLAFRVLEERRSIEFFSNVFLFANKCDNEWLDETQQEACVEARPPVQAFNAGLCQSRSYQPELDSISQRVLVLQGLGDIRRLQKRAPYATELQKSSIQVLPGKNVLPWESPQATCDAIQAFAASVR